MKRTNYGFDRFLVHDFGQLLTLDNSISKSIYASKCAEDQEGEGLRPEGTGRTRCDRVLPFC